MGKMLQIIALCIAYFIGYFLIRTQASDEFCQLETFHAKCQHSEIVMITSALYGRMKIGKCIETAAGLGQMGCFVDVVPIIDKSCSGKSSCEYLFPNKELAAVNPCPKGVTSYLEIEFECVAVAVPLGEQACRSASNLNLKTPQGYISSINAVQKGYGTVACPWRLSALPGQRVSVTLKNFQSGSSRRGIIGYIYDESILKNTTILLSPQRSVKVYESVGHVVQFQLSAHGESSFLWHYEVIGCAEFPTPDNAWIKRSKDEATIGCKHYNKTWQIKCDGSHWTGVVGSCNASGNGDIENEDAYTWFTMRTVAGIPMELIIIAIIGIVLFISICICVCILGQALMSKRRQPQHMNPHFNTDTIPSHTGQHGDVMTSSWFCSYPDEKPESPHIWETPLPEPRTAHSEEEYTLPANRRNAKDKAAQNVTEVALPENIQPRSQIPCTTAPSDGDYAAPIQIDEQQQHAAVPTQPMPEYTLPVKKQKHESSPAHSSVASAGEDDYLLPTTIRPEPIGANVQKTSVFEGSSLKNAGYRPDSAMVDSQILLE